MNQWTKIKDDFWIVEMSRYPKEVRESLMAEFAKENIKLVVLSDTER
jgi:hypothetical protein